MALNVADDFQVLEAVDVKSAEDDDLRLWSITTIIGVLDKPALLYWAAEQTALAAVNQADYLANRVAKEGAESVVKDLRDARFRRPKGERTAADLGTAVHEALEEYALTGVFPKVDDEVRPFLEQFDKWAQRAQPTYHAAELTVYSSQYGFAGTADGIMEIDGMMLNFDYKTTKKSVDGQGNPTHPYPEVGLQISAARYADFAAAWRPRRYEHFRRRYYLLGPAEREAAIPVPKVEGGIVIHITPTSCEAYPVKCDEEVFTAFLYVLESARYVFDLSKKIIGPPLMFPGDV